MVLHTMHVICVIFVCMKFSNAVNGNTLAELIASADDWSNQISHPLLCDSHWYFLLWPIHVALDCDLLYL